MNKNNPKYIVVHCSDVSSKDQYDQYQSINTYHRDVRKFPASSLGVCIGYQHLITGGRDYLCRQDTDEGAHCNQGFDGTIVYQPGPVDNQHLGWPPGTVSMNFQSLGICIGIAGDIEDVPDWAYTLLQSRIWAWQDKYAISNDKVFFHRKFNVQKTCPGSRITQAWLDELLTRPVVPTLSTPIVIPTYPCTEEHEIIKTQTSQISNLRSLINSLISLFK